jgi:hypothetical protein
MQIYNNNEKWRVKGQKRDFTEVIGYCGRKKKCMFKSCNFIGHNGLKNGIDHIRYYVTKILNFSFITDIQAKVIDAYLQSGKCFPDF